MKKFILIFCIILLTSISFLFGLEEFTTEPISLDEFIEEYLPDYTLQKRIPLEGIGRAYTVAKDSGNIVAITEDDDHFNVYYFDIEGNEIWKKEIHEVDFNGNLYKVKKMTCNISDNGETICLYINPLINTGKATGYYSVNNTILSQDGSLLFTEILNAMRLIPSPDGKYLTKSVGAVGGPIGTQPEFYAANGTLITLTGFTSHDVKSVHLAFISNDHIIAYVLTDSNHKLTRSLQLFRFENNTLTPLWEYDLGRQNLSGDYLNEIVKAVDDKIAFGGKSSGSKLSVFDNDGNLLYLDDAVCRSFDFINNDELILQTNTAKGKYSKLINFETKETRKEDIVFKLEERYEDFRKVFELDGLLLFSANIDPLKYNILIIKKDDWKDSQYIFSYDVDFIDENSIKYLIFEKYNENPELIIMRGGVR